MYKKISDYGIIGNLYSIALIGRDGSIDWLCLPHIDSPSIFGAILDANGGGFFSITPEGEWDSVLTYLEDSNVLEGKFRTRSGVYTITDFMTMSQEDREPPRQCLLVRLLRVQRGRGGCGSASNPVSQLLSGCINASLPSRVAQGREHLVTRRNTSQQSKLNVQASGITVDSTSKIDASGKGYLGGYVGGNNTGIGRTLGNMTTGGSSTFTGGSFGGLGGTYYAVGAVYGNPTNPNDLGSGGGSGEYSYLPGGNGGGLIRIISNTLTLNGSILADGSGVTDGGGGSGGAIRIDVGTLSGSGAISAKGGNSTKYGAGGGGRIAVYYGTLNLPQSNIGATGGIGARNGGAGSIYLKPSSASGNLIIDNRGITTSGLSTPLPGVGRGVISAVMSDSLIVSGASWQAGVFKGMKINPNTAQDKLFTIIDNSEDTLFIDPAGGDPALVAAAGDNFSGVFSIDKLTVTGAAQVVAVGRLVVTDELSVGGATLYEMNSDIVAQNVKVGSDGVLTHAGATTTASYMFEISSTTMNIEAGGRIDVTGQGFLGGYVGNNTSGNGRTLGNTGGSTTFSGGSYGGLGGTYYYANAVYGDLVNPTDPGSGGGGGEYGYPPGGNGGGLARIKSGTLTVDGSILADGSNADAGGGSGGGIRIDVGTLSGSGTISARGGNSKDYGGGGGGRVAVYYGVLNLPQANISATGGSGVRNGGDGTVQLIMQ